MVENKLVKGKMVSLTSLNSIVGKTESNIVVVSAYDKLSGAMKDLLLEIKKEKSTPTKLEEKLGINLVTISRSLKQLYLMGLVRTDRDGVKKYFELTETGNLIVKQLENDKNKEILRLFP